MADNSTFSLFADFELQGQNCSERNSLKIITGFNKKLTKNQQTFNRLTKRIEELQREIRNETAKLESLLKIYLVEIPEKRRSLASSRLAVAKALGGSTKTLKYGKREYENVRDVILILCDEAFADMEPDLAAEEFYDSWARTSYKEETQRQRELLEQEFTEQAKDLFGVDIDLGDIEYTPEGFARFAKRMQDTLKGCNRQDGNSSARKKTKKQVEREQLLKEEEKLTLRSIRSIYLSLAKTLHPDTITDPTEKALKEVLMKKVSAAYADKDLPMLLKMEMEWVASESATIGTLPDDKLKLYISSLKEHVAVLELELDTLYHRPRFADLSAFSLFPESAARQIIRKQAKAYTGVIATLSDVMNIFFRPEPKKEIIMFVNEYKNIIKSRNSFSEIFMNTIW